MAEQNKKSTAAKMKNTHKYRRKNKRKTIKSEYASRASPNGPLNIYVADMPWRNVID